MDEKDKKHEALTNSIADMFKVFEAQEILFQSKEGAWHFGGKKLMPAQMKQYSEEADIILNSFTWREVEKSIINLAHQKIVIESKTIDDVIGGKMVLFTMKQLRKLLIATSGLGKK